MTSLIVPSTKIPSLHNNYRTSGSAFDQRVFSHVTNASSICPTSSCFSILIGSVAANHLLPCRSPRDVEKKKREKRMITLRNYLV